MPTEIRLTYTLSKDDVLQLQLFMASISKQIKKTRKWRRWRIPILNTLLGVLLIVEINDWITAGIFQV